ncbi:potassium-transporting ATPase subunit KdpC [Gottfriedia acidiceleris]|uniref:Potassium-transporting ATPase KdpC subunit n=1 Tax=Gottfriedia acidiceleris TaxID=371036 RepID=A0ABY4JIS3_9BACI|nr:potassium-transporting ATPase subunit KdpC [Gottfriedia acidiceleris]UPM53362.1 potassium-transporting ATPase subunit KdpC [Gottfriedia acidiceleris]
MKSVMIAIRTSIVLIIICGLGYPLATTGVAQVIFPKKADGSLIETNGKVMGSKLLAQEFKGPEWFHSRASAANYNPTTSAATNAAVASKEYVKETKDKIKELKNENSNLGKKIPTDLVTTSGSGFDPDLSPEAVKAQVPRVAKATGIPEDKLVSLINSHIKGRQLGIFGEPRVNILELNIDLQKLK